MISKKFRRKVFMYFVKNLRKFVFANFEEILKVNVRKILGRTILRKYVVKFFPNFGNNLRKKDFENFEKMCIYSEFLTKFYETSGKF